MKNPKLVLHPDKILQTKANPVEKFDTDLNKLIVEMYKIMKDFKGAGLAAPQVGVPLQIFTFLDFEKENRERYMINPTILESNESSEDWEGCLSFPGVFVKVNRATKIKVKFYNSDNEEKIEEFVNFTARVIQHEIEHLEGKTFDRYLSNLKRDIVKRKMMKVKKRVYQRTQVRI